MASQEAYDFWEHFVDRYGKSIKESRPEIMLVGAKAGNLYQVYERGTTFSPNSESLLRILNNDIQVGDRVAIQTMQDGGRYVAGKIFETGDKEYYDSPYVQTTTINSATTASTTDTVNYSENVALSLALPPGIWTVTAWGWGMYSHSVANGIVRTHILINADLGAALTMTCPITSNRVGMGGTNLVTGQTGTIPVAVRYRPNASGTAYAGGGMLVAMAFRTG